MATRKPQPTKPDLSIYVSEICKGKHAGEPVACLWDKTTDRTKFFRLVPELKADGSLTVRAIPLNWR